MDKAAIIKKLHEELHEELEGVKEYHEMAAHAMGMHEVSLAKHLRAIAKDEFTHADYIHRVLMENGVALTDAEKQMWDHVWGMMTWK